MANIEDGYGIIAGRGRETAQKALAAAHAAKLDPTVVRTVAEGYLVPEAVLVEFENAAKVESKPEADAPKADEKPKRATRATKKKSDEAPAEPEKSEEAPAESETDKKGE